MNKKNIIGIALISAFGIVKAPLPPTMPRGGPRPSFVTKVKSALGWRSKPPSISSQPLLPNRTIQPVSAGAEMTLPRPIGTLPRSSPPVSSQPPSMVNTLPRPASLSSQPPSPSSTLVSQNVGTFVPKSNVGTIASANSSGSHPALVGKKTGIIAKIKGVFGVGGAKPASISSQQGPTVSSGQPAVVVQPKESVYAVPVKPTPPSLLPRAYNLKDVEQLIKQQGLYYEEALVAGRIRPQATATASLEARNAFAQGALPPRTPGPAVVAYGPEVAIKAPVTNTMRGVLNALPPSQRGGIVTNPIPAPVMPANIKPYSAETMKGLAAPTPTVSTAPISPSGTIKLLRRSSDV